MKVCLYFIAIILFCSSIIRGQDILYTATGNKIKAKVLEINTDEIKYKDFTHLDGPTYVIGIKDIVLINFSNGTTQIINSTPAELIPSKKNDELKNQIEKKKLPNLYYINSNLLSINALALANGDFTLMYDRDFLNNHMSISFLGGYNFNTRMGALNFAIVDTFKKARKKYDIGLGINFMPRNTKRIQYFAGLLFKYMPYTYDKEINSGNNQFTYEEKEGFQFNVMFTNGWTYRISPNFNAKIFASLGTQSGNPKLASGLPKIYLGYCFGYRF